MIYKATDVAVLVIGGGEGGVAQEIVSAVLLLVPAMNSHLGRMAVRYYRWLTSLANSRGLKLAAALTRA